MDYQRYGDGSWRIGLVESESGKHVRKLNLPKPVTQRRISWHPGGGFLTQVLFDTGGANFLLLPIGAVKVEQFQAWERVKSALSPGRLTESRLPFRFKPKRSTLFF